MDKTGDRVIDTVNHYQQVPLVGTDSSDLITGTDKTDLMRGGAASDIFAVNAKKVGDTIIDFEQGTDLIGLSSKVSFGQLSFQGNQILLGNEVLATLAGVKTNTLTATDFVPL